MRVPDELPLDPSLKGVIESRLVALREPFGERALSDYSFGNLYLFRTAHDYRYLPGPLPCISGRTYDGISHLLPLFDMRSICARQLETLLGARQCFFPLPAEVVSELDTTRFRCNEVRDDSDYLYPAAQFLDYDSAGLRAKRGFTRRLMGMHHIRCEPIDARTRPDALAVLAGWFEDKGRSPGEADGDACRQALLGISESDVLSGFIYFAGDAPAGFLLVEELNPGVGAVRFAKGRRTFEGIFPYMFQDLCRKRADTLRWLNFEQDLGLANFRKSKLSYRPSALLSKFRVRPAQHSQS
jgi:hypothetical protein